MIKQTFISDELSVKINVSFCIVPCLIVFMCILKTQSIRSLLIVQCDRSFFTFYSIKFFSGFRSDFIYATFLSVLLVTFQQKNSKSLTAERLSDYYIVLLFVLHYVRLSTASEPHFSTKRDFLHQITKQRLFAENKSSKKDFEIFAI